MPLDYSKWDKLELSDDSDIECHPNVDKASFIRWKQQAIHQEREEKRQRLEALRQKVQHTRNIIAHLDTLKSSLSKGGCDAVLSELSGLQNKMGSDSQADSPDAKRAKEALEELAKQLREQLAKESAENTGERILANIAKKQDAMRQQLEEASKEMEKLDREINSKITSENIFKEGFNKTVVNKATTPKEPPKPFEKATSTEKKIEVLNPESVSKSTESSSSSSKPAKSTAEEDDDEIFLSDTAKKFASLNGFDESFRFISQHPYLVNQETSDAILAEGFNAELNGNTKYAKNCVFQALILQYCASLGKDGIRLYFARMNQQDGKAHKLFMNDVSDTYKRISERCKVLRVEREKEVESIQLAPMEPDAPLSISIPEEHPNMTEEERARLEAFRDLPLDFQEALHKGTLEAVNEVFGKMKGEDAERLLEICGKFGFLSISGVIEEGSEEYREWEQARDEYMARQRQQGPTEDDGVEADVEEP
ncbi:uncharacterized protein VTP21DRAFT_10793 [Calcarisporiella thermophila]|uniref:uncharacterized protein n=1 Tax=Calcarisporiella thermophila TaxID=911321 RepID=UPI003743695A